MRRLISILATALLGLVLVTSTASADDDTGPFSTNHTVSVPAGETVTYARSCNASSSHPDGGTATGGRAEFNEGHGDPKLVLVSEGLTADGNGWFTTVHNPDTRAHAYLSWADCIPVPPQLDKDAIASVDTTPATCEAGEVLNWGVHGNADLSGTPDGTEGPGAYKVLATAHADHLFGGGQDVISFPGTLAGPLTGAACDITVTPVAPDFQASQECDQAGVLTPVVTEGVTYTVTGPDGARVVTATADEGYQLSDGSSTFGPFDVTPDGICAVIPVTPVTPVPPTEPVTPTKPVTPDTPTTPEAPATTDTTNAPTTVTVAPAAPATTEAPTATTHSVKAHTVPNETPPTVKAETPTTVKAETYPAIPPTTTTTDTLPDTGSISGWWITIAGGLLLAGGGLILHRKTL